MRHERGQKQVPGLALALVEGGRVVWAQGYGWADSTDDAPAGARHATTAETLFPAGALAALLPAGGAGSPAGAAPAGSSPTVARGTIRTIEGRRFPPPPPPGPFASVLALARAAAGRADTTGVLDAAPAGFALTVLVVPEDSVAAVVAASLDRATATTGRIAHAAVAMLRDVRRGRAPVAPDTTRAVERAAALALAGRWGRGERALRLEEYEGGLFLTPLGGGTRVEVRRAGEGGYVVDDALAWGARLRPLPDGRLVFGADTLARAGDPRPPEASPELARLVGEYGPEERTLYLLERDGKLAALVRWFDEWPLAPVRGGWRAPAAAGWPGPLRLLPGSGGRPAAVVAGQDTLRRRPVPGDSDAVSFRIVPVRPVEELRREALAATPPIETRALLSPELVELRALDPSIRYDVRYATSNNFMGTPMYSSAHALLQRPAAEAVARASAELRRLGYGLLIHDAYRPWYVTRMFWDATPPDKRIFVADPSRGSRHNRGAAVDLTLYDLRTGTPMRMTGGYDEMSDRSYPLYPGGTASQRWHRDLLRRVMEAQGFTVYEAEWWHFDFRDWRGWPILNLDFDEALHAH